MEKYSYLMGQDRVGAEQCMIDPEVIVTLHCYNAALGLLAS